MYTIKYVQPHADKGVMVYEYADRVEEDYTDQDVKVVRLIRFVTGMSAQTTNETTIVMDSEGVNGPSAVFIENMMGKLVQRISTTVPNKMVPSRSRHA